MDDKLSRVDDTANVMAIVNDNLWETKKELQDNITKL